MKDPILEEIHEARRQIGEECGHDIEQLIEPLKIPQHEGVGRRVSPEDVRKLSDRSKSISTESH